MNTEEKIRILTERNKQNALTFSFVKSISMIIAGLLLFSMVMGFLMMYFFDQEFLENNNLVGAFGSLKTFLGITIGLLVANILALIWFSKGEVLGYVLYVLTNVVFIGFFAFWLSHEFETFALLFLAFFASFSVLIGYYGMRKIKYDKELEPYLD
jgi:nicotinamide riboside transporter PnuC